MLNHTLKPPRASCGRDGAGAFAIIGTEAFPELPVHPWSAVGDRSGVESCGHGPRPRAPSRNRKFGRMAGSLTPRSQIGQIDEFDPYAIKLSRQQGAPLGRPARTLFREND